MMVQSTDDPPPATVVNSRYGYGYGLPVKVRFGKRKATQDGDDFMLW